jgi:hypothetical protein
VTTSYGPNGPAADWPSAAFYVYDENKEWPSPLAIETENCSEVLYAGPNCPELCNEGEYCYPDGTCHDEPYLTPLDVGPISIEVNGSLVSTLIFEELSSSYIPEDQQMSLDPLWTGGETVKARNDSSGGFVVEAITLPFIEVTSFPHTLEAAEGTLGEDLLLTWTPTNPDGVIEISFGTAFYYARCVAKDDGTFTIPWSLIEEIGEEGAGGEFFVFVERVVRQSTSGEIGKVDLALASINTQQYVFVP